MQYIREEDIDCGMVDTIKILFMNSQMYWVVQENE